MNIKKHIPNAITCCNLLCGCVGIIATNGYYLDSAFYLLVFAAVFDFLDGFAARLLKVSSPIGKDLDSLADMVTFGLLPGFIMYKMIGLSILNFDKELATNIYTLFRIGEPALEAFDKLHVSIPFVCLAFISLLIPVLSAIRLAKFNNDTRQSDSFIGLPTPANGLLIASLGCILHNKMYDNDFGSILKLLYNPYVLSLMSLILSLLLVAELPLFALKFKHFKWKGNEIRFIFLIFCVIMLATLRLTGIPLCIILYVLLSVINNFITKRRATIAG